jgi:hypothetical protein
MPVDPTTGAADWQTVLAVPDPDNPGDAPGVYDVKSSSPATSLGGTPYAEW